VILAAGVISFQSLIPLAVFIGIGAFAWWAFGLIGGGHSRAAERLDELRHPGSQRAREQGAAKKKSERMSQVIQSAAPALAKPLQSQDKKTVDRLKTRLANAGFRGETASTVFLGLKFIGLLVGLGIGGIMLLRAEHINEKALVGLVLPAVLMFYLPSIVLFLIAKSRQQAIFLGLPDALDLMVVCVEAGLGLDQAMRKVSEEMKKIYPIIAEEFGLANLQLQMGRPRNEVLHELGVRTGVSDVRSLVGVIIQADKFGSSVAQALRVQSDSMRVRRRQLAEEKAAKTAVKLIFPLVLFIFPGIFVVLVGPAAITMIREMLPTMRGQ